MKVRELIESLTEKQRRSVTRCLEQCRLLDPEEEIKVKVGDDVLEFVRIISNPIRMGILNMLMGRWMCVCLIANALDQDQTLISHHLRSLKKLGLLHERREGKLRFYRTNEEVLKEYFEKLKREFFG